MKVLVVGSGGREHALAWKCAQSAQVEKVFVAPGNGGTAKEDKLENIAIDVMNFDGLSAFARQRDVGLTIIGPEVPLVGGITDHFQQQGLACFGPVGAVARLEGSKSFSKEFMRRHGIPTAACEVFTDVTAATEFVRRAGAPIVVKADGLAAGKGVIVARTVAEAIGAIEEMLAGNRFGEAGHRVVIEQFLAGEEASFTVMSDGRNVLPLANSQDHKARDDGDLGPNTGGMGAYSPAPVVSEAVHERIMEQVIRPTIDGMAADGHPYVGFLYAGLMISPEGEVNVVEFNCRFGDPETQPVLFRLQSDLTELCLAALDGKLDQVDAQWDPRCSLGVVLAAGGYPESYNKGDPISGLDHDPGPAGKVFHAGTTIREGITVTNGGRVLCAVALGEDIAAAQSAAYDLVGTIHWEGIQFRTDIGYRAVGRSPG